MPGIGRRLLTLTAGGILGLTLVLVLGPAHAAAPEWNAVRTHTVQIGTEAGRLVVGFRATAGNTVAKTIRRLNRAQNTLIVQAQTSDADAASLARRTGVAMAGSRQITPSTHVLYLQKTLYGADVDAALKKLRADPAVLFADVDQRRYPHALPDDPLFLPTTDASGQWYMQTPSATTITLDGIPTMDLSATDAVSAWAITTGSSGTVIADVDNGVRFDHPDLLRAGLGGRLLPGYDFVGPDYNRTTGAALGTFLIANDGDGWDPDPSDPGDWINSTDEQNSSVPGLGLSHFEQFLARHARGRRPGCTDQQRDGHRGHGVGALHPAGQGAGQMRRLRLGHHRGHSMGRRHVSDGRLGQCRPRQPVSGGHHQPQSGRRRQLSRGLPERGQYLDRHGRVDSGFGRQ